MLVGNWVGCFLSKKVMGIFGIYVIELTHNLAFTLTHPCPSTEGNLFTIYNLAQIIYHFFK